MSGHFGTLILQARELIRAKDAGFPLSFDLPADEFSAVLILHEEDAALHEERRQREQEAAAFQQSVHNNMTKVG